MITIITSKQSFNSKNKAIVKAVKNDLCPRILKFKDLLNINEKVYKLKL